MPRISTPVHLRTAGIVMVEAYVHFGCRVAESLYHVVRAAKAIRPGWCLMIETI